jgi:hypothetical protein
MKRLFLGVVCLSFPLLPFVYVGAFLGPLKISSHWFGFITAFWGLGVLLVVVSILLSENSAAFKIKWTLLTLCLGLIFLPIYWFKYVRPLQVDA